MKFFLSILPAICFFGTYKYFDNNLIYATIAIIVSTVICFLISYIKYKKISRFQFVLLIVLLIFAVPTVIIKDPAFIKWKVSVVNIMMAIGLLVCQFIYKKDVIYTLSGIKTPIPQVLFKKMTILASIFLCLCAVLNYILAFKLPELSLLIGSNVTQSEAENIWVNYKTYGNGIINFVFTIYLYSWMNKRLSDKEKEELEKLLMEHSSFKQTQKELENKEDCSQENKQ